MGATPLKPLIPAVCQRATSTAVAINDTHLLTYVYGQGLYSQPWAKTSWSLAETGLTSPLLATLNPDPKPYPMALAEDSSGQAWLAAAGGMFTTADPTTGWTAVDLSSSGSLNPLFSDIASNGDSIAAVSLLPLSILPSQYSGLLSGRFFFKSAGETDWEESARTRNQLHCGRGSVRH